MNSNQPRQKAPHTRHFDKTMVPVELFRQVAALGLSVPKTAALLGISTGSTEELKTIGGALKPDVIERVRRRLSELEREKKSA